MSDKGKMSFFKREKALKDSRKEEKYPIISM